MVAHCKKPPFSMSAQAIGFRQHVASNLAASLNVLLSTSILALAYNVVHSLLIHKTSAVTTTVLGQAKIIGVIAMSSLLLGELRCCSCKHCTHGLCFKAAVELACYMQSRLTDTCDTAGTKVPVGTQSTYALSTGERSLSSLTTAFGIAICLIGLALYSHTSQQGWFARNHAGHPSVDNKSMLVYMGDDNKTLHKPVLS